MDPSRGVAVAIDLTCENPDGPVSYRHACGDAIAGELDPWLEPLARQIRHANELVDDGIVCRDTPRRECVIAPTSECEPRFTLVFSDAGALVAVIARNDWQSPQDDVARTDARVEKLLADSAAGCRR